MVPPTSREADSGKNPKAFQVPRVPMAKVFASCLHTSRQATEPPFRHLSRLPAASCPGCRRRHLVSAHQHLFSFQIAKRFFNLVGILTRVYSAANIPRDVVQGIGQNTVPCSTYSGSLNFNGDLNGAPMRMSLGDGHGHASPSCNPFLGFLTTGCFHR